MKLLKLAQEFRRVALWTVVLGGVLLTGGCVGEIYHHGDSSGAAAVSSYASWRISGDLRDIGRAIDDNINTAAFSPDYYPNATFTIDLGKPCVFNMIVLDHGANPEGYARRVTVQTSMDGRTFTTAHQGSGTRRATVLTWVTPVLARYVRVQATTPGRERWSIAEVYIQ